MTILPRFRNWILIYALCLSGYLAAAFSINTLVKTPSSSLYLEELTVGDIVFSQNKKEELCFGEVTRKHIASASSGVRIILDDDVIIASLDQKLYSPLEKIYKEAHCFKSGDALLSCSGKYVFIRDIVIISGEHILSDITVIGNHNFFVSHSEILVHNFEPVITLSCIAAEAIASWIGAALVGSVLAWKIKNMQASCGCGTCDISCGCACDCICSKKNREINSKSESAYMYKNGRYRDANYHHKNSKGNGRGGKSPAPKDGQWALDRSVKVNGNNNRRIGITQDDKFVIFDRTSEGADCLQDIFHGHTRTWDEICAESKGNIKNAFIENGLASIKGKVLRRIG